MRKDVGSDCCWHRGPAFNAFYENRARKARKHGGDERLRGERLKPNTVGPALALLQNVYLVMM